MSKHRMHDMKVHFTEMTDAQLSVVVGRLAGQSNARIEDGQAWTGVAYSLLEPGPNHQEQVEKHFMLSTVCRNEDGRPVFVCNEDLRTTHVNPCRSRVLGALLKTFPSGLVDID